MNPFATSATSDAEVSLSMPSASEPMQPMGFQQPPTYQPPFQRNVCFFHVIFKALAIFVFLFQGFLHTGYIFTFVLVTLFSALDFWTVKNVTGRLLVGLRWHNHMDEDGKSRWRFESFEDQRFVHPTDSNIFWLGLFVPPVIWLLLAMGMVMTFRVMWLVLVLVALTLNGINTYGFIKCKRDAGRKLSAIGGSVLTQGLSAWSRMRGSGGGGGGGGGGISVPPGP